MTHHKRMRPHNRRGGCKLCKFGKVEGYQMGRRNGERFPYHGRRRTADEVIAAALAQYD
ncbi:MAG: hypothetical protein KA314_12570 [Chloroflexi bacterium]|nr:hypothetical protein [Chloroflexota bacterium]MBP8056670.1 hypothetical protein [Chloroflexota bacterium]